MKNTTRAMQVGFVYLLVYTCIIFVMIGIGCTYVKNQEPEYNWITPMGKTRVLPCECGQVYRIEFRNLDCFKVDTIVNPQIFEDQRQASLDFVNQMNNMGFKECGVRHGLHQDPTGIWHEVFVCTSISEDSVRRLAMQIRAVWLDK